MYLDTTIWTPNKAYSVGDFVEPPDANATGYIYRCTVAGASGALPPVFPTPFAKTVGEVSGLIWICAGLAPLFSVEELTRALTLPILVQALDDDNDGTADTHSLNEIR